MHSTAAGEKNAVESEGDFITGKSPEKDQEDPNIKAECTEEKISDPAEFLKEASENTRNPKAYPIKKKWTQILQDKINEIINKVKDAIDSFFNR